MRPGFILSLLPHRFPRMNILTRYIATRVLINTALVLLTVVVILSVVDLVDEAHGVNERHSFADALWVIFLTTPERIYEILPVAVFIGSLIGLGQMAKDSEITALCAAGAGVWRVARVLLLVGLGVSALAIVIGEWVSPAGMAAVQQIHRSADSDEPRSVWLYRDGRYMHARLGTDRMQVQDVLVYELDDQKRMRQSLYAESARFGNGAWNLEGVRTSRLDEDGIVRTQRYATHDYDGLPDAGVLQLLDRPADEMAGADLRRYLAEYAGAGVNVRHYRFAWWQRIVTPLSCIVVLLLTVPFAFTQERGGGLAQRAFWGVVSGLAIYLFNRIGGHAGFLLGLPPEVAAMLPVVLLFLLGLALLSTQRHLRGRRLRSIRLAS